MSNEDLLATLAEVGRLHLQVQQQDAAIRGLQARVIGLQERNGELQEALDRARTEWTAKVKKRG